MPSARAPRRLLGFSTPVAVIVFGAGIAFAQPVPYPGLSPLAAATPNRITGSSSSEQPRPGTAAGSASSSGGLRFGLSYPEILTGMDATSLGRFLDDAVGLGVGWIRFDLPWDLVQPTSPSSYNWSGATA
jgi:hypothetical protein